MRYFLAMLFFSIFSLQAFSQDFAWAKSFGGNDANVCFAIKVDNAGNIITSGHFRGTSDFDPGNSNYYLTSNGNNSNIFISKIDASGNFVWAKSFGGFYEDRGYSLTVDKMNNIYLVGFFQGTVDFDPSNGIFNLSSNNNSRDIFILKLSPSGNFLWAKQIGGVGEDHAETMSIDGSGNIYYTGWFSNIVDFDPSSNINNMNAGSNGCNIFISKMDSNGNYLWAKNFGNNNFNEKGYSVVIDNQKNIVLTGIFESTTDFDPGVSTSYLSSSGNDDIFILKLDSMGNFLWARNMGGNLNDHGNNICVDNIGNIYTTGYFQGTADFDPGSAYYSLHSTYGQDIFISKLSNTGNFIWAKQLNSSNYDDYGKDIIVDAQSNVYTVGRFDNTIDFDPGNNTFNLSSNGDLDIYILKLDSQGNYIWATNFGGMQSDGISALTIDKMNSLYIPGNYISTVDVDPSPNTFSLSPLGIQDFYILKLTQCNNSSSVFSATACGSYTSPSGKYTWTTSGVYTDTIQNAAGCDSTMIINLTIKENSQEVLFVNTCGSYTSPSGKYTWTSSGTYNDTIQNSIGCDSILIIGLIIKPNSYSTISPTACLNYTSPSGKYSWKNSGTYQDTLQNANGCDSILTINLTIKQVDTSVTVNQNILIANANNATYQWIDCNTGPITGETNKSLIVNADGDYAVIVSQNNCSDTSACIPIIVSGIDEHQNAEHYKVYPNPSSGKVTIEVETSVSIEIIGIRGKILWKSSNVDEGKTLIDLSSLNNGIYFIQIKGNKGFFTKKLVLTK